jgi:hypothetical protein
MCASKAGACPSEVVYSGKAPALLANISFGWKGLTGISALIYYEHSEIMAAKIIVRLAPGVSMVLNFFFRDLLMG